MTSTKEPYDIHETISNHLETSARIKHACIQACSEALQEASATLVSTFQSENKVLLCGNGGSASDCQHMATEFVARLSQAFERPPLSAIALTTDSSFITAYSNDLHFEGIFERQVRAHGSPGDTLIAISTSGNSENVLRGVRAAREMKMTTIGLTGQGGGQLGELVDTLIAVPHTNTQFIQESHLALEHILCSIVEQKMFGC